MITRDTSKIPSGMYCYSKYKIIPSDGPFGSKMKLLDLCPYWKRTETGAFCHFLGQESERQDPFNLIWDQCKECGVNMDEENE